MAAHSGIVIAEDDPEDMEMIVEAILLAEPGAQLHKFSDGFSVYEYLHTRPDNDLPSLIILDYNMPQLTGAQVLKNISAEMRYGPVPKIILSTSNAQLHQHECIRNGATQYFVKPSNLKDLNNLARTMIGLRL
ncbi:response regulator [Flavitalea sp. BT771]|uniref:response regulator n=1 Tax=Flavitalea sp. BT771 TaxID=3063329 RepID=UPI0026E1B8F5|nr:response regulator [Flavitalea sp. BT771]MDO6430578.1 response regulator [Flavitalea sp. BT771]MDV6219282.1 response regulator [Flavitalea sp. BT771]